MKEHCENQNKTQDKTQKVSQGPAQNNILCVCMLYEWFDALFTSRMPLSPSWNRSYSECLSIWYRIGLMESITLSVFFPALCVRASHPFHSCSTPVSAFKSTESAMTQIDVSFLRHTKPSLQAVMSFSWKCSICMWVCWYFLCCRFSEKLIITQAREKLHNRETTQEPWLVNSNCLQLLQ